MEWSVGARADALLHNSAARSHSPSSPEPPLGRPPPRRARPLPPGRRAAATPAMGGALDPPVSTNEVAFLEQVSEGGAGADWGGTARKRAAAGRHPSSQALATAGLRLDGRRPADVRPPTYEFSADGATATVALGRSRARATVSATLAAPYPDR